MTATELKTQLNRETVCSILAFIGIGITRDFHFVDDKSISISKTGYIKNFGNSGFTQGDIFDYLSFYADMSLNESIDYVSKCLGVTE